MAIGEKEARHKPYKKNTPSRRPSEAPESPPYLPSPSIYKKGTAVDPSAPTTRPVPDQPSTLPTPPEWTPTEYPKLPGL